MEKSVQLTAGAAHLILRKRMEPTSSDKPLKNRRYEKFAHLVASGVVLHRAWQQISASRGSRCKKSSAQQMSSHLIQDRPEVAARIEHLRQLNAQALEVRHEFKRETAIDYLVSILQTPIGDIDERHPLCEGRRFGRNGTVFWMPSKLAAMDLLCRMMPGWLAPVRGEMSASPEAIEMLRALRNGDDLPRPIDITPELNES